MLEAVYFSQTDSLRNGGLMEVQCWSLLLADWALSSGCSHTDRGEWKSMLLSLYMISIPATKDTFFMTPLDYDRSTWVIEYDHQGKICVSRKAIFVMKTL